MCINAADEMMLLYYIFSVQDEHPLMGIMCLTKQWIIIVSDGDDAKQ